MCEHLGPEELNFRLDPAQRERTRRYLQGKFVSLSSADIDDVLSQAQTELIEKPPPDTIGSNRSLGGLLFTIAKRRARDMIRQAGNRARTLKRLREKVRADAGPEGRVKVRQAYDPLELAELQEHVIKAFEKLDPDQWAVISIYCDEYPRLKGPSGLLKALTKESPEIAKEGWTPAKVRRLLNQARAIVRIELRKKGYEL